MPFDSLAKALIGEDARTPLDWARKTFCVWLSAKLNDANGPYASVLGVNSSRPAFVLEDTAILRAMYKRADKPPVVGLMQGPSEWADWQKSLQGQVFEGKRIGIEWDLDCGVGDRSPTEDDLAAERADDSNLASFVQDAVESAHYELDTLGLFDVNIEPDTEKQKGGQGRHPHKITLFIRTLPSYVPPTP